MFGPLFRVLDRRALDNKFFDLGSVLVQTCGQQRFPID